MVNFPQNILTQNFFVLSNQEKQKHKKTQQIETNIC